MIYIFIEKHGMAFITGLHQSINCLILCDTVSMIYDSQFIISFRTEFFIGCDRFNFFNFFENFNNERKLQ